MINLKIKKEKTVNRKGVNQNNFCVYTPEIYSKEIIDISLEKYFRNEFSINKLNMIRGIDLSCGDGNLLLILLEKLILKSKELSGKYYYLDSWITGYDIDSEAIISIREKTALLLDKYNLLNDSSIKSLEMNFKKENSLFILENIKYNIVIGNPPYLGEKNNIGLFSSLKKTEFGKKFYEGKMDYFYYFIEKGIELLEDNGILTYITTNYWIKADSAKKLREHIRKWCNVEYINNINTSVFCNAPGQHNMIFSLVKSKDKNTKTQIINNNLLFHVNSEEIYDLYGKINIENENEKDFSNNLFKKKTHFLEEILNINQGIISGYDKAFVFDDYKEEFGEYLKPLYKNKEIGKYKIDAKNRYWILYSDSSEECSKKLIPHLEKYKEKLSERREVKLGIKKWWELLWGRTKTLFTNPAIVVRQRCKTNLFAYTEGNFYGSADIYYLTPKYKEINIFYILGYLNSEVFLKWYKTNGKCKGYNLEFYSTPLKKVPIIYNNNDEKNIRKIEILVKKQIELYTQEIQNEIDEYFYSLLKN